MDVAIMRKKRKPISGGVVHPAGEFYGKAV